jgi:hypothetical protein
VKNSTGSDICSLKPEAIKAKTKKPVESKIFELFLFIEEGSPGMLVLRSKRYGIKKRRQKKTEKRYVVLPATNEMDGARIFPIPIQRAEKNMRKTRMLSRVTGTHLPEVNTRER